MKGKEERGRGEMCRHTGLAGGGVSVPEQPPSAEVCCAPTVTGMHTESVSI